MIPQTPQSHLTRLSSTVRFFPWTPLSNLAIVCCELRYFAQQHDDFRMNSLSKQNCEEVGKTQALLSFLSRFEVRKKGQEGSAIFDILSLSSFAFWVQKQTFSAKRLLPFTLK